MRVPYLSQAYAEAQNGLQFLPDQNTTPQYLSLTELDYNSP